MLLGIKAACLSGLIIIVASPGLHADDVGVIKSNALKEGALNLSGFSQGNCSFGTVIESFAAKYPEITVTEMMPEATSEEQMASLRSARDNPGPGVPDVVHLNYESGPAAKAEGLLQPFIAIELNELPQPAYDVEYGDRYWSGAYFYVAALLINRDAVPNPPQSWADLLKPEYAGQIAFQAGSSSSPMVALATLSAGRALASADKNAAALGLDHFAAIAAAGNLAGIAGTPETVADGTTPILILSDADALKARDALAGVAPLDVVIPMRGVTADIHLMAISATAPHPYAAKLWFEHFYSGKMQLELLRGNCHPIRWSDFADWDMIPEELTKGKPSNFVYTLAQFPTLEQRTESAALVASQWDAVVGAP